MLGPPIRCTSECNTYFLSLGLQATARPGPAFLSGPISHPLPHTPCSRHPGLFHVLQRSSNLTALADAPLLAEEKWYPGCREHSTQLWRDNSQLSHILGTGNSEMNETQSLLSRNSQSSKTDRKVKQRVLATSYSCTHTMKEGRRRGGAQKGHVTQVRGIKKGFLEEVTFGMCVEG